MRYVSGFHVRFWVSANHPRLACAARYVNTAFALSPSVVVQVLALAHRRAWRREKPPADPCPYAPGIQGKLAARGKVRRAKHHKAQPVGTRPALQVGGKPHLLRREQFQAEPSDLPERVSTAEHETP